MTMYSDAYSTRITVHRDTANVDDPYYGDRGEATVASGVRAHIDFGSGSTRTGAAGTVTSSTFQLTAEPCDLRAGDRVLDESTGERYTVEAAFRILESQPHVTAGLEQIVSS
jgi:hypothetical protein